MGSKAAPAIVKTAGDSYPIRILQTKAGNAQIRDAQLTAIRKAKKRIYMQNAYLSDDEFVFALCQARRRGVDVRVVIPKDCDTKIMHCSNRLVVNTFVNHGVKVYHFPKMSHIKAAVFDDWVCFGTANYDKLSLVVNRELNLATSAPQVVKVLVRDLFEKDFNASKLITDKQPVKFYDHLIELVADEI